MTATENIDVGVGFCAAQTQRRIGRASTSVSGNNSVQTRRFKFCPLFHFEPACFARRRIPEQTPALGLGRIMSIG